MAGGENKLRAAFVVPWFGKNIPGGAEAEARRTAQELAARGVEVRVLTTCLAGLGSDWDHDILPPGRAVEDGLIVERFPTAKRDGSRFGELNVRVCAGESLSASEEDDFFRNMVHSPELMDYIAAHPEYGPFFHIPYLFTTSVWGPLIHPEKSVLIPCLHDEGYARMRAVRQAFEVSRAIVFHVPAERDLGARLYDLKKTEPLILGEGIDTGWEFDAGRFKADFGVDYPFILYAGRKDAGKNVPLLVQYFLKYKEQGRGPKGLKLLMIGNLPAPIPAGGGEHIIDLGFVEKQQKYDAYAAADLLIQPSLMESFSIVIMEAWLAGTTIMVHSGCAVTAEHAENSGGGLHFRDYPHFAECLDLMLERPELRAAMAEKGREYVLDNYSWPVVTERYHALIERISAEPIPEAKASAKTAAAPKKSGPKRVAVHQMLPDFAFGDAIGSDVLALQKTLHAWGLESDIFALNIDSKLMDRAVSVHEYADRVRPEDIVLMHFSIGHNLWDQVAKWPGRKVLRYHNITPAKFLEQVNPESARRCLQGREQLPRVCAAMELGMGVSDYNCRELTDAGLKATHTVPIMLDLSVLGNAPDRLILERFNDDRPKVLHVGRIAPNKCIEDLIKTQYWLAKLIPGARMLLVGSDHGWGPYSESLRKLSYQLNVPDLHFSGHVSFAALMAYYQTADAYLCLSEHEGFCVPLVESMYFGLPIVAYEAAGVPGTLGDGGILLSEKDHVKTAEVLAEVLSNPQAKAALQARSRARLEAFRPQAVEAELKKALAGLGLEVEP